MSRIWRGATVVLVTTAACLVAGGCAGLFNDPPIARFFASPTHGEAPLQVRFDARTSYDPNGDWLTYSWSFGDGGSASGETAAHVYSSAGRYVAVLTVRDSHGEAGFASLEVSVSAPPPPIPETPDVPSSGDFPFPNTGAGFWDFVDYCQSTWVYEADYQDELVQSPGSSFAVMRGDCDDYAVMVAGYTQEYWRYDTFVAALDNVYEDSGHAVAFVKCDLDVMRGRFAGCGSVPYWTASNGNTYMPVDFHRCPGWNWYDHGGSYVLEYSHEWDWFVGRVMRARGAHAPTCSHLTPEEECGLEFLWRGGT